MTNTVPFDVGRLSRELQRTEAINQAQPVPFAPIRQAAQNLSRRGVLAAKTELCNSAMLHLVELLYEVDDDGELANVDRNDWRILLPLPWGRLGCKYWGLRVSEANALRWLMLRRQQQQDSPLVVFDAETRQWLVGGSYPTKRVALAYLRSCPLTLAEWRDAWENTRSRWSRGRL